MMIENLESRRLLSATAFLNGETLQVTSNNKPDNIEISYAVKINGFDIVVRNNGADIGKFDSESVDAIVVNLGGGNDTLVVTDIGKQNGGMDPKTVPVKEIEQLIVNAGGGDDFVWVDPETYIAALIFGQGGNDTLWGGYGNDTIYGGAGNDAIYGNGGADMLFGQGGFDTLYGGKGDDFLSGGASFDIAIGNDGADSTDGTNEIENL